MLKRLLIGLLKGILIGGALGAAMHFAMKGHTFGPEGVLPFLFYGAVVGITGVFAGQEPWKQGAWISSILKGVFGFLMGMGLFWVSRRFLGTVPAPGVAALGLSGAKFVAAPLLLSPALSTVYSTLVELDDGGEQAAADDASNKKGGRTGVRASAKKSPMEILDEIDVEEDEKAVRRGRK
jgi:hypothetical protein